MWVFFCKAFEYSSLDSIDSSMDSIYVLRFLNLFKYIFETSIDLQNIELEQVCTYRPIAVVWAARSA